MGEVLRQIIASRQVTDGVSFFPVHSSVTPEEGTIITGAYTATRPSVSVEIGLGYGVSALYACDVLAGLPGPVRHIIIDPFQAEEWRGIGLRNLSRAGYDPLIDFRPARSEIELPKLLEAGTRIQAAIIDGWGTFDHALVNFFYVNKMLDVDGIVILICARWPSIQRLVRHLLTYPAYRLFDYAKDLAPPDLKTRIRRALVKSTGSSLFRRPWDAPTCVALRKVAEDTRNWDWHAEF